MSACRIIFSSYGLPLVVETLILPRTQYYSRISKQFKVKELEFTHIQFVIINLTKASRPTKKNFIENIVF